VEIVDKLERDCIELVRAIERDHRDLRCRPVDSDGRHRAPPKKIMTLL